MEIPLLNDILIVFGLSIAVIFLCHRLHIPAILGFLLTGVLVGPHGLHLIKAVHEVEVLAEIGIILLLFTIGIEFSLKNFFQIKRTVLLGGTSQVFLTLLAGFGIARSVGLPLEKALFVGCFVSLSSTAIVLKLLQEKAEVESPHGKTTIGILIYQDIIVVPLMLLIPLLAGIKKDLSGSLLISIAGLTLLKGLIIIILVILSVKWVVPKILRLIAGTRSRELFLLTIIVLCLSFAWFTYRMGLSLALGAFLAGLVISESEYGHHTLGNILPFRDIFMSFFFISIGMLLNSGFLLSHVGFVFLITLGLLASKTAIAALAVIILGFPIRTAILVGLTLSQIGEFSFILLKTGMSYGLLSNDFYQLFLNVTLLSMALTPFIISLAPRFADSFLKLPLPKKLKSGLRPLQDTKSEVRKDHLIIVGYGMSGRNLARAARQGGIPYVIIEMNPETVVDEQKKGESIYYGDATHGSVLEHAHVENARIAVVAVSDPAATRRIVELIKRLNPMLYTIVRTRFTQEMKTLLEIGADEVISEDFETSVEIFARVLNKYLVPRDEIEKYIATIRAEGYEMLRNVSKEPTSLFELKLNLSNAEFVSLRVKEGSPVIGKTLSEIQLRRKFGITLLAVQRVARIFSNPGGDMRIWANDIIVLFGPNDKIREFSLFVEGSFNEKDPQD